METLPALVFGWRSALMLAVFTMTLVIAVLLVLRPVEQRANQWLAAFMVVSAFMLIPYIIGFAGFYDRWRFLTFLPMEAEALLGPLVYFHVHTLVSHAPLGRKLWLLAPGLAIWSFNLMLFVFLGSGETKMTFSREIYRPYLQPLFTLTGLGLGAYALWKSRLLMTGYQQFLANTHSDAAEFQLDWLKRFFAGVVVIGLAWLATEFAFRFFVDFTYKRQYLFLLCALIIVIWLGLEALMRMYQPFPKMSDATSAPTAELAGQGRDWRAEAVLLADQMKAGQWFLEPRLSVTELARRLGSNETYISRTLNQGLGKSFNQYVNELRVDYAKQLIREGMHAAIIDVAFASGFNSKATFNRVFREIAGEAPSSYRERTAQNP